MKKLKFLGFTVVRNGRKHEWSVYQNAQEYTCCGIALDNERVRICTVWTEKAAHIIADTLNTQQAVVPLTK